MASLHNLVAILLIGFSSVALVKSHNLSDEELLAYNPPEDLLKNFPYYISGYDDEGAPVWVWEMGKWDMRTYVEAGGEKFEAFLIGADQMFLRFAESGKGNGTGFVNILDLDGFSLKQAGHTGTVQLMLKQFQNFQKLVAHGDLKAGYLINANPIFSTIWELGKPLLGGLSEKIHIYGNNPDSWKPILTRAIPKSQLPEVYGGDKGFKPVVIYG